MPESRQNQAGIIDYIIVFVVVVAVLVVLSSAFIVPPEIEALVKAVSEMGSQVLGDYSQQGSL